MIVDILVVAVILISVVIAFLRGLVREVLTILGIIGSIAASYIGGPLLLPYMNNWLGITEENISDKLFDILPYSILSTALSYGIILLVFGIILSIISHFLAGFVKTLGLGALDRTLGVIFGFIRGVFVLGLLYLPFFYLVEDEQKDKWFGNSKTHLYLEITSSWIDKLIPETMDKSKKDSTETIKNISSTRKKLEDMDLLDHNTDKDNPTPSGNDGYSPEFRENMNKLFEYNADTSPDYNE